MKKIFNFIIRLYQNSLSKILKFYFGPGCRFEPTCSEYAGGAIKKFGVIKGTVLSIKRLFRCQPWGNFGYDPVPKKF